MTRPERIRISLFRPATPRMRAETRVARTLLLLWLLLGFGVPLAVWVAGSGDPQGLGASALTRTRLFGFPLHYWLVGQGCTLGFVLLTRLHGVLWRRWAADGEGRWER